MFSLKKKAPVLQMPKYDIYVSDVNKINLEFNQVNDNIYFRYETNDILSEKIPIKERIYTFEYDFASAIKIILGDDVGEEEMIFEPNDISKKISILGDDYYYLENNALKNEFEKIDGEYINIYENKALTSKGEIYNLNTNTVMPNKVVGLKLMEEKNPLAQNTYTGKSIETYYKMSKIVTQQEEHIAEYQIFIKNGKLYVIDGGLDIYGDSIIIDSYNNKEYQTALGKDGVIYDFKESLNYPKDFENENIVQMTNNINNYGHKILLMYENGRIYAFDYITGNVLFDSNKNIEEEKESIVSTLATSVMSLFSVRKAPLYSPQTEEYEEAIELQEKLVETPVEQVINKLNENAPSANLGIINTEENSSVSSNQNNNITEQNENMTSTEDENSINISQTITDNEPNITHNATSSKDNTNSSLITENSKNSYVTVYDSDTNEYLVYKTSSILSLSNDEPTDNKKDIISETEKIESNPKLKEYYENATGNKGTRGPNGAILISISIFTIAIILIVMYKKKNYA